VGSETEVIGIGNRRGDKLVKDMGMIGGDKTEKGGVSLGRELGNRGLP